MLDHFRRHASADFLEASAIRFDTGLRSRIVGGRPADRSVRTNINGAHPGGFCLACVEADAKVEIGAPAKRGDYELSIPVSGAMASTGRGDLAPCLRERTVLASPGAPQRIVLAEGALRLALRVSATRCALDSPR